MPKNNHQYSKLDKTYSVNSSEKYMFISYAVRGPTIYPQSRLLQDMPVEHPLRGPVLEPSPLNTRYTCSPSGS